MTTIAGVGDMYEAGLFVEDFTTFLATAPHTHGATGTRPAPAAFQRITVDDVTFTYPAANQPALSNVSLQIDAGQVVALVGENGSGKTTLAKLLSRLYLPDSGRITWDGVDTADLDAHQLRRRIVVIFQASPDTTSPPRRTSGWAPWSASTTRTRSPPPPGTPAPTST
jgi:ATP-binding cassette, subfamily B, bacterial